MARVSESGRGNSESSGVANDMEGTGSLSRTQSPPAHRGAFVIDKGVLRGAAVYFTTVIRCVWVRSPVRRRRKYVPLVRSAAES